MRSNQVLRVPTARSQPASLLPRPASSFPQEGAHPGFPAGDPWSHSALRPTAPRSPFLPAVCPFLQQLTECAPIWDQRDCLGLNRPLSPFNTFPKVGFFNLGNPTRKLQHSPRVVLRSSRFGCSKASLPAGGEYTVQPSSQRLLSVPHVAIAGTGLHPLSSLWCTGAMETSLQKRSIGK